MNRWTGSVCALGCAIGLAISPATHAGPISSSMSLAARAVAGPEMATSTDTASWGVPLSPLAVSVSAYAVDAVGEGYASAFGSGTATWAADGLSGTVSFTNVGWDVANGRSSSVDLRWGGDDWTYTFVADSDGVFSIDYQVVGLGSNLFGLWGWYIAWSGLGGDILSVLDPFDPNRSATASRDLTAGETYTVSLRNNANLAGEAGLFSAARMNGLFNWRITAAPNAVSEPGSLALLLAATLVALAMRGRAARRGR